MQSLFIKRIQLFFNNIKQLKIDRDKKKSFINDIKHEIQDPRSKFNQLHLSTNENYDSITTIISIPENFQLAGSDIMKYQKLMELVKPIMLYINNDINYGQYFLAPEFYYIDSINNNDDEILNEVSCSYVAEWKFTPLLSNYPNFKWELTTFIGINTLILGAIITILIILI